MSDKTEGESTPAAALSGGQEGIPSSEASATAGAEATATAGASATSAYMANSVPTSTAGAGIAGAIASAGAAESAANVTASAGAQASADTVPASTDIATSTTAAQGAAATSAGGEAAGAPPPKASGGGATPSPTGAAVASTPKASGAASTSSAASTATTSAASSATAAASTPAAGSAGEATSTAGTVATSAGGASAKTSGAGAVAATVATAGTKAAPAKTAAASAGGAARPVAAKSAAPEPVYLSSSPHFTQGLSTRALMLGVLVALLPECVFGVLYFGAHALAVIAVSVASCALFEWLFQRVTKQKVVISNLSCCVSGVMLALVLPSTTPLWQVVLGAFVAMVVAKGLFGGIGSNVFNPALTGRAFLFVSFPAAIGATWFDPAVDAVSGATVLSSIKAGSFTASGEDYLQLFLGNSTGCIGETSALLILLSFVYLLVTGIIDWRAPLAMVVAVALCTLVTGGDVIASVLTGGLLFGAVFMVTDYATSPVTRPGRLVFGAGCGLVTFLIRKFGGYPEGVMFSILIMNAIVPFLNNLTSRMYGYARGNKGAIK